MTLVCARCGGNLTDEHEVAGDAIRLELPVPISSNRYWGERVIVPKGGGRAFVQVYVTPEAQEYRDIVRDIALGCGVVPIESNRVTLEVQLYPHRPVDYLDRMRKFGPTWDDGVQCIDLGNCEKVLSDALQGCVIGNDRSFRRITLERMEPDGVSRVVIVATPVRAHNPQAALL